MAIALGGHAVANNTFTTSTTTSGITTQASGSTFVVCVQTNRAGDPIHVSSIVDSKGNTYTLATSDNPGYAGDILLAAYVCVNGTGGASHTVTATFDEQATNTVWFVEITGADTSSPADGVAHTTGGGTAGTSMPGVTVTTTNANDLILSFLGTYGFDTGTVTITANTGSGWAIIDSILTGSVSRHGASSYVVKSSTGSYADTYTSNSTDGFSVLTLAFKAASAGGGAIVGSSTLAFGQTGTLNGAGALGATSALTFAQTGALKGAGTLAGSSALTFGQTGTLTQPGLVGSAALTFGQTGSLTGSGVLAGTSALQFGQTAQLVAAGALTGASAIAFSQSGNAIAVGVLAGTSAFLFAQTAALVASGVLAGTSALTFNASATADLPAGALTGTSSLNFGQSGALSAFGALIGNSQIIFDASGFVPNVASQPGPLDSPLMSEGHYRRRKKRPKRDTDELVEPTQPVIIAPASFEREIKPEVAQTVERASLSELVAADVLQQEMDDEESIQWILLALE